MCSWTRVYRLEILMVVEVGVQVKHAISRTFDSVVRVPNSTHLIRHVPIGSLIRSVHKQGHASKHYQNKQSQSVFCVPLENNMLSIWLNGCLLCLLICYQRKQLLLLHNHIDSEVFFCYSRGPLKVYTFSIGVPMPKSAIIV